MALADYSAQVTTGVRTAIITVDMLNLEIAAIDKEDEMPGNSKAYNFLISRKAIMKTLNLEDRDIEEGSL